MTLVHTTIQPSRDLDVDAAELESLTRQGLIVGVSAIRPPSSPTDTVTSYVYTTIRPGVLIGVGAAELESLTRQGLIYTGPPVDGGSGGFYGLWQTLATDPTLNLWAINHATTSAQVFAFSLLLEG